MSTNEPVAWANFRHDPPSYIPYRTEAEAKASVERSEIAATQDGPFSVEPLVLQSDLAAAQKRIAELEAALNKLAEIAACCDGWESFPQPALNDAYNALTGEPR